MFENLTTRWQVILGFAVAFAGILAVSAAAALGGTRLHGQVLKLSDEQIPAFEIVSEIEVAEANVARNLNGLALERASDPAMRKAMYAALTHELAALEEARKGWKALAHDPEAARLWEALQAPLTHWEEQVQEVLKRLQERDVVAADGGQSGDPDYDAADDQMWNAWLAVGTTVKAVDEGLKALDEHGKAGVKAAEEHAESAYGGAAMALGIALLLSGAAMAAIAWVIGRRVDRSIRGLLSEAGKLTAAVEAGKLDVRGDPGALSPEFQPIVAGVNKTVEAFVKPIQVAGAYVDRISKGDIPPKITDRYEGDFDALKQNLNRCIDAVGLLVEDAAGLARAAVEGKLQTRADASRHQGDFRKVVEGVNHTLDSVLSPIEEARKALERLAERDLTARMQGSYQGDHAAIKEALNSAAGALHDALGQVAEAVEQVSSAAGQIASSSQAVASGASEQASSLEETHSSLESMSSQTRQSADSAQQADTLAGEAKRLAEEGAGAMDQMTGAMGNVRRSAEGTSAIIKDISEIAFQTNLLALNAAVEAARAGEAGRGFAVVAEEVRSLALRAKDAAVKTEELIKESVKHAGEGEKTAAQVSEQLGQILGAAMKVSGIVSEMAASAKEQAQGIEQVNKAVGEMDKVTQQNAASSEESSSAAEELSSQSEELAAMVGSFKIERATGQRKVLKRPAAARAAPRAVYPDGKLGEHPMVTRPEDVMPLPGEQFKDF